METPNLVRRKPLATNIRVNEHVNIHVDMSHDLFTVIRTKLGSQSIKPLFQSSQKLVRSSLRVLASN